MGTQERRQVLERVLMRAVRSLERQHGARAGFVFMTIKARMHKLTKKVIKNVVIIQALQSLRANGEIYLENGRNYITPPTRAKQIKKSSSKSQPAKKKSKAPRKKAQKRRVLKKLKPKYSYKKKSAKKVSGKIKSKKKAKAASESDKAVKRERVQRALLAHLTGPGIKKSVDELQAIPPRAASSKASSYVPSLRSASTKQGTRYVKPASKNSSALFKTSNHSIAKSSAHSLAKFSNRRDSPYASNQSLDKYHPSNHSVGTFKASVGAQSVQEWGGNYSIKEEASERSYQASHQPSHDSDENMAEMLIRCSMMEADNEIRNELAGMDGQQRKTAFRPSFRATMMSQREEEAEEESPSEFTVQMVPPPAAPMDETAEESAVEHSEEQSLPPPPAEKKAKKGLFGLFGKKKKKIPGESTEESTPESETDSDAPRPVKKSPSQQSTMSKKVFGFFGKKKTGSQTTLNQEPAQEPLYETPPAAPSPVPSEEPIYEEITPSKEREPSVTGGESETGMEESEAYEDDESEYESSEYEEEEEEQPQKKGWLWGKK